MEEIRKEPATFFLIVINIVIFIAVEFTGAPGDTLHVLKCGAAYTPYIVEQKEYYRLFTAMFLHFGIEHLLNNMLVLFALGSRMERILGGVRFLTVYFAGGLAGNVLSLLVGLRSGEYAVSGGASGAVFAVMGSMIYAVIRNKGRLADLSVRQIFFMAALSLYFGFASSDVDNAAHIGGLIGGFILAVILYHPAKRRGNRYPRREY